MYKNILIAVLLLVNFINVEAKKEDMRFIIYGDSMNIQEAYEKKEILLKEYEQLIKGLDEKCIEIAIKDYLNFDHVSYANHTITLMVGDGKGKVISGVLKTNYCDVEGDEIKTEFFFKKIWKSVTS